MLRKLHKILNTNKHLVLILFTTIINTSAYHAISITVVQYIVLFLSTSTKVCVLALLSCQRIFALAGRGMAINERNLY